MITDLIGRKEEQKELQEALSAKQAELVAVVGRRRVGKTFMINTVYQDHLVFEITGIQNATKKEQLVNFMYQLGAAFGNKASIIPPTNWLEAFTILIEQLEKQNYQEKKVIFLDELPWLATHRSGFLKGLSFFWNSWVVKQKIVLVICGSAASWMIHRVVNHQGGLHNRISRTVNLEPFTLTETKAYLKSRNIELDHYQILTLYMAMGGIPHYLNSIRPGKSAVQNIDQICFSKTGLLKNEFDRLYPSLFNNAEKHIKIIRALATKQQGLTRNQIIHLSKLPEGGNTTKILKELEHSGFIATYTPFEKKKKGTLFRLIDEYSLFYLRFIEGKQKEGAGTWHHFSQTQAYKTWSGYAFESICLKHVHQIKKALSIAGIYSTPSSFFYKGTEEEKGTQIDLVLDRNDQVVNLFEIKFHREAFTVTKAQAEILRNKISVFKRATKTRKQIFLILIAAFGLYTNKHSLGLVSHTLTMEDLFL